MQHEESHLFLGIMALQEAKNHQIKLKSLGVEIQLSSNPQTCRTGSCGVTVEVWGKKEDEGRLSDYFNKDFLHHLKGHGLNSVFFSEVFDPNAAEVICQACGAKFSPTFRECPDCGLVY